MSIELILGPMYSGKTTELLRRMRRYKLTGNKILVIGNTIDSRSGDFIKTHDGTVEEIVLRVNFLFEVFKTKAYEECDIIVFDECQFYPDLIESISLMEHQGKIVLCAGLSGNYKKKPFENVSQLISIASKVDFLSAICTHKDENGKYCGECAPFSCKIGGSSDEIEVGGLEIYAPRCNNHFTIFI